MKIKEIISEAKDISSRWDTFAKVAGDTLKGWGDIMGRHTKMQGFYQPTRYSPDANKEPIDDKDMWDVKKGIRKADTDNDSPDSEKTTSGDQEQPQNQEQPKSKPRKQQPRQEQPKPKDNPNRNINTKIDYLKSIGVLQSARITDDEKQYIESTDVWVDTNKLQGIDPSTTFFQTRAPHHHMFIRQIVVPARDLGYNNNVNYQLDLTPAGWWSSMHRAYINPNSKLGQLVDDWADSHQG